MRFPPLAIVACLVTTSALHAADGDAKKLLPGRWAPVAEKAADPAAKPADPKAKMAPKAKPAPKPKLSARAKAAAKKEAARKVAEELPKFLIEFTKDGKVLLDGEPDATSANLRFVKPLAAVMMRVSPETRAIKINYEFKGDDTIEVFADHGWLMEKLAGGGSIPPDKVQELNREYRPRETLRVAATAQGLTLTNEQGKTLTFRRYAGTDSLDVAEGKRREADIRRGMDGPIGDMLRRQGINTGTPANGKDAAKPGAAKKP